MLATDTGTKAMFEWGLIALSCIGILYGIALQVRHRARIRRASAEAASLDAVKLIVVDNTPGLAIGMFSIGTVLLSVGGLLIGLGVVRGVYAVPLGGSLLIVSLKWHLHCRSKLRLRACQSSYLLCPRCFYALHSTPGRRRCSECGLQIELDDVAAFWREYCGAGKRKGEGSKRDPDYEDEASG